MIAWVRALVSLALVALLGWGALETRAVLRSRDRDLAEREARITELAQTIADRDARIVDLETALRLLKVDHRLARVSVLGQTKAPDGSVLSTEVGFQELTPDGYPLGAPSQYTLAGDVAYVDALVIKFEDDYVERGDVWRGTSICLFRRLFGERQQPAEGFPLDTSGRRPGPYADDRDEGADRELWARFWDYANDPELARGAGVRAMHGEAPYMKLREGRSYLVELRASSGLTIRVE